METYNNKSSNDTSTLHDDRASTALGYLSMILPAWIVIANVFVLVCFVKHRSNLMKSAVTMQILTLSATDLLSGISIISLAVTTVVNNISYEVCLLQFVLFFSSQVLVLFHILGICVSRLRVVRRITALPKNTKNWGLVFMYLLMGWVATLVVFYLPFGIWGKYRPHLPVCSLNEVLQDNYQTVIKYCISIFIVPSLLTNAIYIAVILKLRFSSRKVASDSSLTLGSSEGVRQSNISRIGGSSTETMNRPPSTAEGLPSQSSVTKFSRKQLNSNGAGVAHAVSFIHWSRQQSYKAFDESQVKRAPLIFDFCPPSKNIRMKDNKGSTSSEMEENDGRMEENGNRMAGNDRSRTNQLELSSFRKQRKALSTIGLLLCVYDICVIPFIAVFSVEGQIEYELPRNWKVLATTLLTVNSAINPFIYTWKIESFRKAVGRTIKSLCCNKC